MNSIPARTCRETRQRKRWQWLRDAFAVEDPADFVPTQEQVEMVDDVCNWMIGRGLTTAALIGVEMHRPANYIVANILHFLRPSVSAALPLLHLLPILRRAIPDMNRYRAFAAMLEHRGAADYLVRRLEQMEAQSKRRASTSAASAEQHEQVFREHDDQDRS